MQLSIIPYPHPTLRVRSKPIRRVDQELRDLVVQILDFMYEVETRFGVVPEIAELVKMQQVNDLVEFLLPRIKE